VDRRIKAFTVRSKGVRTKSGRARRIAQKGIVLGAISSVAGAWLRTVNIEFGGCVQVPRTLLVVSERYRVGSGVGVFIEPEPIAA
jgi:hypothetical protein